MHDLYVHVKPRCNHYPSWVQVDGIREISIQLTTACYLEFIKIDTQNTSISAVESHFLTSKDSYQILFR